MFNGYNKQLAAFLKAGPGVSEKKIPLTELFHGASDEFWFWLFTDGYDQHAAVRELLPGMPDTQTQLNFTGRSGHAALSDAFSIYQLIKNISHQYARDVSDAQAILDFGCGWGRIIRFFSKDLDESKIYGVDCYDEMIELCRSQNLRANFQVISPMPPMNFPEHMFDLIYLYSVFSHLSEETHLSWIREFDRILNPGGIVIASTRPRSFIEHCAKTAKKKNVAVWELGPSLSFANYQDALRDYDAGKFIHCPTGGPGVLDKSFFGETCIPKQYAETVWTRHFSKVHYMTVAEHRTSDQDIIVAIK
jgi:2-polyprenyl-3-methyl-5-hydroxy-6-metoxy-1,4-benzoquinol methylase